MYCKLRAIFRTFIPNQITGRTQWGALEEAGRTPLLGEMEAISHPLPEGWVFGKRLFSKLSTRRPRLAWAGLEIRGGVAEDGVGCSLSQQPNATSVPLWPSDVSKPPPDSAGGQSFVRSLRGLPLVARELYIPPCKHLSVVMSRKD